MSVYYKLLGVKVNTEMWHHIKLKAIYIIINNIKE